jgi:hypothetical protein
MATPMPPYGVAIKDALASKDLKKMKAVVSQSIKHIRELETGLKSLQNAIQKLGKK